MLRLLTALVIASSLLMAGCSEDSPSDPAGDPNNSFRVDGNGYNNILIETIGNGVASFAAEEDDGQTVIGTVLMQGTNSSDDLFTISLAVQDVTTGTFNISQTAGVGLSLNVVKSANQSQPDSIYFANGGTITIDEWGGASGTARGTFDVTAVITPGLDKQITVKGSFELNPIRTQ